MVSRLSVSNSPTSTATYPEAPPQKHPTCETCNDPWVEYHSHLHKDGTYGVPSFDGGFRYYWVKRDDATNSGWSCTCPRFRFHGREACKHIRKVVGMVARGEKHDMPSQMWLVLMQRLDFSTDGLYD